MQKICQLGNHIPTFETLTTSWNDPMSWGVCGAMVCSWLSKLKKSQTVRGFSDLHPIGQLILAQGAVLRSSSEEAARLMLFERFGLELLNQKEFYAAGKLPLFSHEAFANDTLMRGASYLSIRWLDDDDDPQSHAIGVSSGAGGSFLFDPNFCLWSFTDQNELKHSLSSLLSAHGVKPDVQDGPYPVLSGTIYYLK